MMDAVMNGEVSDDSADKEEQNPSYVETTEVVPNQDADVISHKNGHNTTSSISLKEISEGNINATLNESSKGTKEMSVGEENGTINSLMEHSVDSVDNCSSLNKDSVSELYSVKLGDKDNFMLEQNFSESALITSETSVTNVHEDKISISQSETTGISGDIPENEVAPLDAVETAKSESEIYVASINGKSNLSDLSNTKTTNAENDANISNTIKDSVDLLSSYKTLDSEQTQNLSSKIAEESASKDASLADTILAPKLIGEISDIPHVSAPLPESTLFKDTTINSMDSKTSENSDTCVNTESNPLEQLNQHIKAIGCDATEMHNYSLSKPNSSSTDKSDLKEGHKDNTSVDRLKESDSFVFTEISEEETGFPEIFTGLVTIGKYISVKGDFTLRSSEALVESPSLIAPYLLKEPDTFPSKSNDNKEQKDFFHSAAGELLIGIGISCVNEWFHRDMTRIKKRQMKREGKSPQLEEELKFHEMLYNEARKANKTYNFPLKVCKTCNFTTESSIVMEGHLLMPHITARRDFQCNFCDVFNRDPKVILEHMYRIHGKAGRIQSPFSFFECPYCSYENNSKVKLSNHLQKCQRFFDPRRNQAPSKDFEFPALTPKPITVAVVKAYEKSLSSMQRGRGRPKKADNLTDQINLNQFPANPIPVVPPPMPTYRPGSVGLSENLSSIPNQIIPPIQMPNMNLRPPPNAMGQLQPGLPPMHLGSTNRYFQVVNSSAQLMPMLSNSPLVTSSQFPFAPNMVNSSSKKVPPATSQFLNSFFGGGLRQQNPPKSVPEVTITPLPKLQGPYPVPFAKASPPPGNTSMQSNSLVVCEICDGYIKDLEQLRTHMQLIHKVKIHPKMLVSRPPLNCQKCQWRFFTDQGLERHLLGAHGLVTSNMQELANKCKDAGCCTICGRVYASKLVSHMNQVHKLTLKPAHLSYKCTVCSATFNLYRLFENHVYLVHSGAAKRPVDGSSNPSKKLKTPNMDEDDYDDLPFESEPKNHKDKRTLEDSDMIQCSECGNNFRKNAAQIDKCEKCLNSDVSQGILSTKMS